MADKMTPEQWDRLQRRLNEQFSGYRIPARDPQSERILPSGHLITPPIYDGPMTPEVAGFDRTQDRIDDSFVRSSTFNQSNPKPLTSTPQQDKGMPGLGSMPMNMGLLQLGAGMLSQSGWQDDDVSPGQAFGRAMPGAINSYMTGVKALQDRDLYKAKMQDVLDVREREQGLKESLPGVIDNLKGKVSGIPDARFEVIKSLVKSAPEQAAQIVSNLASQASGGKYLYETATTQDVAAGFKQGSIIQVDPNTGKRTLYGEEEPGEIKTHEIPGGVYLTQDGKYLQTLGTSKSSEKSDLEKINPAFQGLFSKDPRVRAAARFDLTKPKAQYVPELDGSGNPTGNNILTSIPRELGPELERLMEESLKMDKGEVPDDTSSVTSRPKTNVEESDVGYNALAKRLLPPGTSQGEVVAFADQLAEWNPDFPSTNLPLGQEIFTGPPESVVQPQEKPEPIVKKEKLSERQGKVNSYARQFSAALGGLDELYKKGYRPDFKIWNNILSRIEENRDITDTIFVHEILPGTQLSEDDKQFASLVLTMGTRSIRSLSGAALKGSELRDELDIMFPIIRSRGLNNSDELERHFRKKRIGVLGGFLQEGGALPKINEKIKTYETSDPFTKSGTKDLIKKYNLEPKE